jgi:excinuclease UvrABC nuclease subunit
MMQCLYRHFDKDGQVLYVGISLSAIQRLAQHREVSFWFDDIAKITIERFQSRQDALKAERDAIQAENPKHNVRLKRDTRELPTSREIDETKLVRQVVTYKPVYTFKEAAEILNVGTRTIHLLTRENKLGTIFISTSKALHHRITGWQLIEFIENQQNLGANI